MTSQNDLFDIIAQQAQQLTLVQKVRLVQQLTVAVEQELAQNAPIVEPYLPPSQSVRIKTPVDQITYQIIGCAMKLHRRRGPGYKEHTYQRDLEAHFKEESIEFASQKMLAVYDSVHGHKLLGYYIPDFIVAQEVVVEIKALHSIDSSHIAQTIGYLATSGCAVGLLINFGRYSLQWQRIFPPKDIQEHQINRQWLFVPDYLRDDT